MLLITGATGTVGKEIVKKCIEKEFPFQIATRSREIEGVYFDFEDPGSYKTALKGIEKLFLMRPPHITNSKKYIEPVIYEAKRAGVRHIVFLSLLGAEKNPVVPHSKIEKIIKHSSIPYTFLRPSFFMQNLFTQHGEELKQEHKIIVPAGKGKTSFIDVRDIAAAAVKVFFEEGHINKGYSLTGSEALSYYEVADILTEQLGVPIQYTNPTVHEFKKKMSEKGIEKEFITVMTAIYLTARFGLAKKVTNDLENLLGKKPITFKEFAKDYQEELI